jgi:hypothetical protein
LVGSGTSQKGPELHAFFRSEFSAAAPQILLFFMQQEKMVNIAVFQKISLNVSIFLSQIKTGYHQIVVTGIRFPKLGF